MIKLQSIIIPDGFLQEETRNGYTVSAEMKKVWAVELDLVQCFINVCEKHGLRYFACGGTLLGAARHQGFIPWDNDVDLFMPMEDYIKLREIAGSEFQEPYFLQSEYDCARAGKSESICRLRNTETTAILRRDFDMKFSYDQGIWIDIHPMNGMAPASEREEYIRTLLECMTQMDTIARNHAADVEQALSAQIAEFDRLRAKYPVSPATKKIVVFSNSLRSEFGIYNAWYYQKTVQLPFEMLTVAAPYEYKNVLRDRYGVWRKASQQFAHGDIFFDTDKPSAYWLNQPSFPKD